MRPEPQVRDEVVSDLPRSTLPQTSTGDRASARQSESGAIPREPELPPRAAVYDAGDEAVHGGPLAVEEPEIREPVLSTCHYCGATYEGVGDDCGGCRLTGEDLVRYGRDRAAALAGDGSRS